MVGSAEKDCAGHAHDSSKPTTLTVGAEGQSGAERHSPREQGLTGESSGGSAAAPLSATKRNRLDPTGLI